ncbi:MAG TPA: site-specific tyrosine recombinase XerD [Candidatus Alistipes pullicola]|nr:site-specific tyrosine recombinase XerD [Candidatus Alistipes pullicola]
MGSWEKELQEYIYYIRLEKKLSDNTVEAYIRDLKQMAEYLEHEFSIRPQQAEERHIEAFLAHLYDKGVKKTTQARILSGIKSFYYYLLINDRIENLPTEFIDPPKTGRKLPDVLSVAEIESIIHTFDSDTRFGIRNKAMVETLYSCGLRVSELITLRLSDLFFNDGFIRVIGKGDKQRLVPISETARHRIEEYLLQRQTMQTNARDADTVFLNNKGRGLTRVMIFHIIKKAALAAGITKTISPHTFRHSFATHLLEGGASIRQVQEMLGHESILTTEIYTHLDSGKLRENVDLHHPLSDL